MSTRNNERNNTYLDKTCATLYNSYGLQLFTYHNTYKLHVQSAVQELTNLTNLIW